MAIRNSALAATGLAVVLAAVGASFAPVACGDSRLIPIRANATPPVDAATEAPAADVVIDVPASEVPVSEAGADEGPVVIPCPTALVGFATVTNTTYPTPTTGGAAGPVVRATTLDQLQAYAAQTGPLVIEIATQFVLTGQIPVTSDKTLRGVAPGAGLSGGGLFISDVHNVVVQNLTISKALGTDAITVQRAQHVWIDHCDLSSDTSSPSGIYDGLVDITHACDFVTVSWTLFHDHLDNSLVGGSPNTGAEDTGHLTVTFHHNWFVNVLNHSPRVRFGSVHVFNNLYEGMVNTGVISQMSAAVLVDDNVFRDSVKVPITTVYTDTDQGTVNAPSNDFEGQSLTGVNITMTTSWTPPYFFNADSTDSVQTLVPLCSGPQFP